MALLKGILLLILDSQQRNRQAAIVYTTSTHDSSKRLEDTYGTASKETSGKHQRYLPKSPATQPFSTCSSWRGGFKGVKCIPRPICPLDLLFRPRFGSPNRTQQVTGDKIGECAYF